MGIEVCQADCAGCTHQGYLCRQFKYLAYENKQLKAKNTGIKVKDLLNTTGGNTKVVIFNTKGDKYKELWRGIVDDIDFNNVPYGESIIEHLTVINGEDILQIHINY